MKIYITTEDKKIFINSIDAGKIELKNLSQKFVDAFEIGFLKFIPEITTIELTKSDKTFLLKSIIAGEIDTEKATGNLKEARLINFQNLLIESSIK